MELEQQAAGTSVGTAESCFHRQEAKRVNWDGTLKTSPAATHPSSKAIPPKPKQLHQLWTKYLNIWVYGGHSHSNHHMEGFW